MNIKSHSSKYLILLFLGLLLGNTIKAQEDYYPKVESFENDIFLKYYKTKGNTSLSPSNKHHLFGKRSLKWNWNGKSSFSTQNFELISHEESPLKYGYHFPASPTFTLALYNEKSSNSKVKFTFTDDRNKSVWFEIELKFTGWRTIWVPFFEMNGDTPPINQPVYFDKLIVSTNSKTGTLYFDDIVFSQFQDNRHVYPDLVVPFIKKDQDPGKDHWMPTIANFKRIQNLKTTDLTPTQKEDLISVERILDKSINPPRRGAINIESLKSKFAKLNLVDDGNTVKGPPMQFKQEQVYFDKNQQGEKKFNKVDQLGKILDQLAHSYDRADDTQKVEIEKMFIEGTKYYLDQGWQAGSCGGTRHHIGYNVRELTEAFFIMRTTLAKNGLLNDVGDSLQWLFNLGMILGDENNFHVNIDYLNTQAYYHLMLIFLVENQSKQNELLKAYSNYLTITLAQQKQEWGFKVDGTVWHHNGHYPAYGMGAFRNVPKVIQTLSQTQYRIGEKGHSNFRNAFLATRLYSQLTDFGFGNAGRHPFEGNNIESLKRQYLQMAYSGNPDNTEKVDKEVASAYLRIWGSKDPTNRKNFEETYHIKAEKLVNYESFPYGATAVHRYDDWAAILKGYSKYVWASEIYVASNRYGRYPANGSIELLNHKGEKRSGFRQNGWDWNRYPGTTVIDLPFEELEPNTPLIMFRSNETFAGAVKQGKNGLFAMILNEGKGSNADGKAVNIGFPGKLKAKKSVFSFGDKLVCIGTDISSIDKEHPTQTNLFQVYLRSPKRQTIYTESKGEITKFPYEGSIGKWIVDPNGSAYHILSDSKTEVTRKLQNSFNNKYSIRTGKINPKNKKKVKETQGKFATAWIDHGFAPKDASYQYVIYPFLSKDEISNIGNKFKKDKSFKILEADSNAHIVSDKGTNITGYAIFNKNYKSSKNVLLSVSEPSLVMIKEINKHNILLSVVQPDLNFKQIKSNHFENFSNPVKLEIEIKGEWNGKLTDKVLSITKNKGKTKISFICIDGATIDLDLTK